jgi:hypothetical protein
VGLPSQRWRRLGVATAVVLGLLAGTAGCSGNKDTNTPAAVASDPAGEAALAKAVTATAALRSYAFRATQTIRGGAAPQTTVVAGRAVRPASLSYTVTVGRTSQEVVKIGRVVYVRIPPATWKQLVKPTVTVDPVASLTALLEAAQSPRLSGTTLTMEVPAAALSKAQLAPTGAAPGAATPVTLALDAAGRVMSVSIVMTVKAGAKTLTVEEATLFSSFGSVPAITKP